ncbi:MAG: HIRAN domain-containing protein [Helicobacteraceae bacterium]|nr:HIRAN domain-containing protein [Candidatus Sulfurimonas ponti]
MRKNAIVAGTGFEGRDKIIKAHCKDGMKVILKRDPTNQHDKYAISVLLEIPKLFGLLGKSYKSIGFIKSNTAKSLAKKIDNGILVSAKIVSYYAPSDRDFPRVTIEVTDEVQQIRGDQ